MTFSIIIPIYNVEPYIKTCLDAVCNQPYDDYEVILIDDASPDNSVALCEPYLQHPQVRLLHNDKNCGLSETRNIGLAAARGEWVWFVDSDDIIGETALEQLSAYLSPAWDILFFSAQFMQEKDDGHLQPAQVITPCRQPETTARAIADFAVQCDRRHALSPVWNKLYRRTFLLENHLRFQQTAIEDIFFNLAAFSATQRIRVLPKTQRHYFYRRRSGSLSHTAALETQTVYHKRYCAFQAFLHANDAFTLKNRFYMALCFADRLLYVRRIARRAGKQALD